MAGSKAEVCPVLSEEESNFLRFANLVIRVSPRAVRTLFDVFFPPVILQTTLNNEKKKVDRLQEKRIINQLQMNILYPTTAAATVKSDNMDLTLMICLLRNLRKMKVQDVLPIQADISQEADLSRIKYYRNWIAHSIDGKINNADFLTSWTTVAAAAGRIGGRLLKDECDRLLVTELDSSYRDVYLQFIQTEARLETVERELDVMSKKVTELDDPVPYNIRKEINEEITSWKEKDKLFFASSAVTKLLEIVKTSPFVLITGSPGMGKSATAHHIALVLNLTDGYEILIVNEPNDIILYKSKTGARQLFIIDDMCGKFFVDKNQINVWQRLKSNLTHLFNSSTCPIRVIVTCRLQIFCSQPFDKLNKNFCTSVCNLLSEDFKLSTEDKRKIGLCYLESKIMDQLSDDVINDTDMFPLLCTLFSAEDENDLRLFEAPYDVFEKELNEMKCQSESCFLGLALLVIFNNELKTDMFDDGSGLTAVFDAVFEECELSNRPAKLHVLKCLKTLEGTYLKMHQNSITAIHDKVFDIIALFMGKNILKSILQHGSSILIRDRVRLNFVETEHPESSVIIIPIDHETMYFERMLQEIKLKKFGTIWHNAMICIKMYQVKLISFLERHDDISRILVNNRWPLLMSSGLGFALLVEYIVSKRKLLSSSNKKLQEESELYNNEFRNELFDFIINFNDKKEDFTSEGTINFEAFFKNENAPLCLACILGFKDIVRILLQCALDINYNDNNISTPLAYAVGASHSNIVKLLLDNKSDVNIGSSEGETPLHIASRIGNRNIAKLLVTKKAEINKQDSKLETPLFKACKFGHTDIVDLLVQEYDCDVNICNVASKSPLHAACENGNDEVVEILLSKECDINRLDERAETPLFKACRNGNINIVGLLLEKNCDFNCINVNGETALNVTPANISDNVVKIAQYTIGRNRKKINEKSIQCAIDLNLEDTLDCYDEDAAGYQLVVTDFKTIFLQQTKVSVVNLDSALRDACIHGDLVKVEDFLSNNRSLDPNTLKTETGQGLLHIACNYGHKGLVKVLLDYKCNIDEQDVAGETALFKCCRTGNVEIVRLLLERNCNVNLCSSSGISPLHIACDQNRTDVVECLLDKNCDVNICDTFKRTALFTSCVKGNEKIVELLIQHKCNVHVCTVHGECPLQIAVELGNTRIEELLRANMEEEVKTLSGFI